MNNDLYLLTVTVVGALFWGAGFFLRKRFFLGKCPPKGKVLGSTLLVFVVAFALGVAMAYTLGGTLDEKNGAIVGFLGAMCWLVGFTPKREAPKGPVGD